MTPQEAKRLRVRTEVIRQYYVRDGDWIYAGPFDTKAEAEHMLREARTNRFVQKYSGDGVIPHYDDGTDAGL